MNTRRGRKSKTVIATRALYAMEELAGSLLPTEETLGGEVKQEVKKNGN
jgi:hypothetical protein